MIGTPRPLGQRRLAPLFWIASIIAAGVLLWTLVPSVADASGPATLGRTGWEVSQPYGPVHTDPFPTHGAIGFYDFIPGPVPGETDASWSDCGPGNPLCPNPDTIGMAVGSRLGGTFGCLSSADFTFFQSFVSIPEGTTITQFSVNMGGADDGARVAIYNSAHPTGFVFAGSYIFLGGSQSTTDLSTAMVAGEVNRVLITQVDDCAVANNLQHAEISLNGVVVPPDTNDPPVADAGGPYVVAEGASVLLAGSGTDPDNDPLIVEWDLDDDGVFETANATPSFDGIDGPAIHPVTVRVTDPEGLSDTASTTVTVDNVAPTITAGPEDGTVHSGETFAITVEFTDPGVLDTHEVTVDWGDGTVETFPGATSAFNASHNYLVAGDYLVVVTVTDKDGASDTASATATVTRRPIIIDVKPTINLNGNGVVAIHVFSSADFDATSLDVATVHAGVTGLETTPVHAGHADDLNGDGLVDMVFHFREGDLGIDPATQGQTLISLFLTGDLPDGTQVIGEDAEVRIAPNNDNPSRGKGGKGPK